MTLSVALSGQVSACFALDVAFEVPAHGVTALLGPSGSGKTSVLRAIAGLARNQGRIAFGGQIWQGVGCFLPPHERRVGYVFQGAGLLPHLSVRQNLDYAAKRAPDGPYQRDDVIARTEIAPLLARSPARLSGGEAQRANIARALLSQPRLLLMDEPLAALDVDARADLLAALQALLAKTQTPVMYVTHDRAEAERIADRIIWLKAGWIDRA